MHAEELVVALNVPAAQEVHAVLAVDALYEPALHEVQVDAPLPLYVPAAQEPHTEETEAPLVVLNVPAAQEVHAELAADALYEPALHEEHDAASAVPAALYFPALQL